MAHDFEKLEPLFEDTQSDEQKWKNLSVFQQELLEQELKRGHDLCEIIYSLMDNNGPTQLTDAQRQMVSFIKANIESNLP